MDATVSDKSAIRAEISRPSARLVNMTPHHRGQRGSTPERERTFQELEAAPNICAVARGI